MSKLTNEELCRLAKDGDLAAAEELINNNMGFIADIAGEMHSQFGKLADYDELVQEGRIAMWKCVSHFDDNLSLSFISYAKRAIKNAMIDVIRKRCATERSEGISLDDISENDGQMKVSDFGSNDCFPSFLQKEQVRELYRALSLVSARERTYLMYRFGFADGREHSVDDTAKKFSISVRRAKLIEKTAIDKMRKMMDL